MEAASFFKHPAVEPLASALLEKFNPEILHDACKRMIGHMVRQIMEVQGFNLVTENVPMSGNALFSTGACYGRKN
jgi:hypothetical protein